MSIYRFPKRIKKRFFNPGENPKRFILIPSLALLFYTFWHHKMPLKGDMDQWVSTSDHSDRSVEPVITWLGHATLLIQVGGINILTDPVFEDVSLFFKRILPLGIQPDKLPPIDVVLISHNHLDHMDKGSLEKIRDNHDPIFLVPEGDKPWFKKYGFSKVFEHSWWEEYFYGTKTNKSIKFSFLPSRHWSQRTLFGKNTSLWGSWMISYENHNIYFAGDSGYDTHFKDIGKKFGSISAALLPIGPCEPAKYMLNAHVNPQEACQAIIDLNARRLIPIHWGTFSFGTDSFDYPMKLLLNYWREKASILEGKILHPVRVGEQINVRKDDFYIEQEKELNKEVLL